jgi:hypothetical protein
LSTRRRYVGPPRHVITDDDQSFQRATHRLDASPWVEGRDGGGGDSFIQAARGEGLEIYVSIMVDGRFHPAAAADQDFIAAARNAIPDLIVEVRRFRAHRS